MKVFVYFNLRRQLWSLKALEGSNRGRVIAHRKVVALSDCEFKVSEAGRRRVLREGRKNVHAGVVGYWRRKVISRGLSRAVTYNPFKGPTFIDCQTVSPIFSAPRALLRDRRAYIPARQAV